jgi:VWFA-related protein
MRNITCFLLTLALVSVAVRAQQPGAQTQAQSAQGPAVTFKVEINYVEVDAVVTDAQGNFAGDLKKEDFQVLEDGKPQTLSIFAPVEIPIERVDPPLFAKAAIRPDVASNRVPFEGRVFVIVLDDENTRFQRTPRSRAAAKQFVERYVGANDLVAVVNTSGRAGAMQDFTDDRQRLIAAIDRAMGAGADSSTKAALADYFNNRDVRGGGTSRMNASMSDLERSMKARNTLSTLKNVADYLAGMRGRRKAVVWITEGINYDVVNVMQNQYATEIRQQTQDVIAAATRANVSFYAVDPRGLTSGMDDSIDIQAFADDNSIGPTSLQDELRLQHDSMRAVSEQTGGFAMLNSNDYRDGFARIQRENSNYYVLGYYPTNEKRDGRFRAISVKVSKPGLNVRARSGYVAPKGKSEPPKLAAGAATSPELRDALSSPIPISGLTVSAFTAPFKGAGQNDAIALAIEIDGSKLTFAQSPEGLFLNDLEVSLFASDSASGKVKDGGHDVIGLKLRPQTREALVNGGSFRIIRRLQLPPGKYQLRVGAREKNGGLTGTVVTEVDAPDFSKAPLTMSGIALTSVAASHVPTASPDPNVNEFKDVLPAPPTAAREFAQADTLTLFTEIYDNAVSTPHRVAITASVLADDGKVVFTTSDERKSEELQGSTGGYGYRTQIPLSGIAAGRYVLRVEAKSLLGNSTPIKRELEFRVR